MYIMTRGIKYSCTTSNQNPAVTTDQCVRQHHRSKEKSFFLECLKSISEGREGRRRRRRAVEWGNHKESRRGGQNMFAMVSKTQVESNLENAPHISKGAPVLTLPAL